MLTVILRQDLEIIQKNQIQAAAEPKNKRTIPPTFHTVAGKYIARVFLDHPAVSGEAMCLFLGEIG